MYGKDFSSSKVGVRDVLMTASSSAWAACIVPEFVARVRKAEEGVEAVFSESAPNRDAGTKLESRLEKREKDCGSAALASRRCLQRLGGADSDVFTFRTSCCTTRTKSTLSAASSRSRR